MTQDYIPADPAAPSPEPEAEPSAAPAGEPVAPESPTAGSGEAWRDVVTQLNGLGEAIGRWASAAASDPAYREHAAEFKAGVERIASSIGDAFDDATKSDVGQQFADAATKTGEAFKTAGERVSQEAAPRIASAFGKAAATLQRAAERMERAEVAEEPQADEPGAASAGETPVEPQPAAQTPVEPPVVPYEDEGSVC